MNYKRQLNEFISLPTTSEMLEYLIKYLRNITLTSKIIKIEYSYLRRVIRNERKLNNELYQRIVKAYLVAKIYPRLPPLTKAVTKSLTTAELREMRKFVEEELAYYQQFVDGLF